MAKGFISCVIFCFLRSKSEWNWVSQTKWQNQEWQNHGGSFCDDSESIDLWKKPWYSFYAKIRVWRNRPSTYHHDFIESIQVRGFRRWSSEWSSGCFFGWGFCWSKIQLFQDFVYSKQGIWFNMIYIFNIEIPGLPGESFRFRSLQLSLFPPVGEVAVQT